MEKRPILSPRLKAIADSVSSCSCMADIGTDHAYLPAWLCLENRCQTAIATDVNHGPLQRAEETVRRHNLSDRVSLRLGSGAAPLQPNEADAIVIAGMGGLLIGELLNANPEVFAAAGQILLQPMSSIPELREQLYRMGYSILEELLVKEEEKLYHILSVEKTPEAEALSQTDFILGKRLCRTRPRHFEEYLATQKLRLDRKLAGLSLGKTIDTERIAEAKMLLAEIELLQKKEES